MINSPTPKTQRCIFRAVDLRKNEQIDDKANFFKPVYNKTYIVSGDKSTYYTFLPPFVCKFEVGS